MHWRGRRTDNGRQKTEIMVMTSVMGGVYGSPITLANLSR